ncbi:hypothetical protein Q0590_10030 [Rhodocytophaga aerolata]|uniref:Porin n=1 Tax=Rhodocytophaga aerolata TaxID=455078 RepID=A0ABT8R5B6_9BACT|nr:hypothetical protein [Rhodocytophaga aerolata]MDO1446589.1 hypothetical protein [Rhodocytophaga aerolata]
MKILYTSVYIASLVLLSYTSLFAQHGDHTGHDTHQTPTDTVQSHEGHLMMHDSTAAPMSHAFSLNLPMNRNGSGSGWLPDLAPMYGYMIHTDKWMYMVHGNVFVRYNNQDITNKGTRGDTKIDAPNWFMAMGQRRVGKRGLFRFSTMFSLDPLFGGDGYPLLFQTGETFQGQPLVDRQHPHNLFSELSVAYTHMLSKDIDVFAYLAYPGEPALGPVAFMHRPSSFNNLDSPLGHHWQDATHITFGVATAGIRYKIVKAEASVFTGREPGEARYGLDKPRFDSYSYRLSVNPTANFAIQASQAFIKSPEVVEPEEDVWRTTASVLHALPLAGENYHLNSALIWGFNDAGGHHKEHSLTAESNLQLDKFAVYGRYEWVQKSSGELQVEQQLGDDEIFDINALTLGTNYTVLRKWNTNFSLGIQGSVYMAESRLNAIYGNNPLSGQVYLRISPHLMPMAMNRTRQMSGR